MNCKPNDLAIIVGGEFREFHGRIVRVSELDAPMYPTAWRITEQVICPDGLELRSIEDQVLRPIRDPGPLAVDEMVQRCGSPTEATVDCDSTWRHDPVNGWREVLRIPILTKQIGER